MGHESLSLGVVRLPLGYGVPDSSKAEARLVGGFLVRVSPHPRGYWVRKILGCPHCFQRVREPAGNSDLWPASQSWRSAPGRPRLGPGSCRLGASLCVLLVFAGRHPNPDPGSRLLRRPPRIDTLRPGLSRGPSPPGPQGLRLWAAGAFVPDPQHLSLAAMEKGFAGKGGHRGNLRLCGLELVSP